MGDKIRLFKSRLTESKEKKPIAPKGLFPDHTKNRSFDEQEFIKLSKMDKLMYIEKFLKGEGISAHFQSSKEEDDYVKFDIDPNSSITKAEEALNSTKFFKSVKVEGNELYIDLRKRS